MKKHPNLWEFIEFVKKLQESSEVTLMQLEERANVVKRKKKYNIQDEKIAEITTEYINSTQPD
jgi:hypothetical protein